MIQIHVALFSVMTFLYGLMVLDQYLKSPLEIQIVVDGLTCLFQYLLVCFFGYLISKFNDRKLTDSISSDHQVYSMFTYLNVRKILNLDEPATKLEALQNWRELLEKQRLYEEQALLDSQYSRKDTVQLEILLSAFCEYTTAFSEDLGLLKSNDLRRELENYSGELLSSGSSSDLEESFILNRHGQMVSRDTLN